MFHQFEPHLISADDRGNIAVYEWEKNSRLNYFSNGTPKGVPITTLRFVNEDDIALLMTATGASLSLTRTLFARAHCLKLPLLSLAADGDVRLFRSYESPDDVKLISSFQGMSEELPRSSTQADAGLVVEWQQGRGQLLMGGNVKYIRVWDATRELTIQVRPPLSLSLSLLFLPHPRL